MAGSRKDNKGRVLRKGETQRSCDNTYIPIQIRKENGEASTPKTFWNCGNGKLNLSGTSSMV